MKPVIEKPSPLLATELVTCEVVRGRDFGCVWHYHPEVELTLVRRGGTERWVGDNFTPLAPDDLVLLGSGLPHDYRNVPVQGVRRHAVEAVVIQFPPQLLGEEELNRAAMEPVRQLFRRARVGLAVKGRTHAAAKRAVLAMARTTGLRRLALLLELLADLAESKDLVEIASAGFQGPGHHASFDRVGAVCAHIEEHLAEPLYAAALAQMAGLSESAFSRLFQRCTGRTLPAYLNELRIARACRLLAETDRTVKEIADACGFGALAHFQRQFQRHQRRSPVAYRAAVRGLS